MRKRFGFSLVTVIAVAGVAMGQGPTIQNLPTLPAPALVDGAGPVLEDGNSGPPSIAPPQGNQFWVNADCLLWWFKGSPLPVPLLTTTSNPNSMPIAGFADPSTTILLGNQDINTRVHEGVRCTAGFCLDPHYQINVEASGFWLGNQTTVRSVASNGQPGSPILAVPFFDQDAVMESSFLLASPGSFAGSAIQSLTSRLWGAEFYGVVPAFEEKNLRVEVLAGFRLLDLTEKLSYFTSSTGLSAPNTDLVLNTLDQFGMRNLFYGFQVGGRADYQLGNFEVSATGKFAVGDMLQTPSLYGFTATNFFNAPAGGPYTGVPVQTMNGSGVFVQSTNLGRISRDKIAIAPEIDVTFSYHVTRHLRAFAGYDLLYINRVLRPGNQIDREINFSETVQSAMAGTFVGPGSFPAMTLVNSDFWAQGIHAGLEFSY